MSDLTKHPASYPLAGVLGALGLVACGPLGPSFGETGETDGTGIDGTGGTDATSDPTEATSEPTGTTTPTECMVDSDCDQGYCGSYCAEGICRESYGCCGYGVEPVDGGKWRCSPPPYYECYGDNDCQDGLECLDNICTVPLPIPLPACRPPDMEVRQWNLGEAPGAFVLADLDLDLDLDLAAAQPGGGTVEIALNDGAGNFTQAATIPVGAALGMALAAGDVDGDGDLDLVVGRDAPDGALVLLFNDGGVFTPDEPLPTGLGPGQVFLADTNGDGALDLVTIGASTSTLGLRLGDGAGAFFVEQPAVDPPVEARATVLDVTGDGIADLLAPLSLSPAVGLWIGFVEGLVTDRDFPVGSESGSALAADLDLQGLTDVVVVEPNADGGLVHVWLGANTLTWPSTSDQFQTLSPLHGGVLAEFSGGPGGDLVAATGVASVALLPGDGRGGFACEHVQPTAGASAAALLAVGDVDGDGLADIVAGGQGVADVTMMLLK